MPSNANQTATPIEHCRLRYECRQTWDGLEVIPSQPTVRYCGQCQAAVHLVRSYDELRAQAAAGRCVATDIPGQSMVVGEPQGTPYTVDSASNP